MSDLTITIRGIDELNAKFDRIQRNDILLSPMERSVERLKGFMARYPRQRNPRSTYRRTGTLGRRWTTRIIADANGLTGVVGNNTIYAPRVQSNQFQAPVHKGHWQTDKDAILKNRGAIERDFEQAIQKALK